MNLFTFTSCSDRLSLKPSRLLQLLDEINNYGLDYLFDEAVTIQDLVDNANIRYYQYLGGMSDRARMINRDQIDIY